MFSCVGSQRYRGEDERMNLIKVVEAYKNLQKENEKLQNNLTQSQDKQLRRISEMKEV